jgi:hypothetical protein
MRALLLLLVGACASSQPPPEPPTVTVDAGAPLCEEACATLSDLRCPESLPTRDGESCVALCQRAERDRRMLPVACVAGARRVADVRGCGVRCLP